MDNDAFKDLVRSKVKSTKEIAREAVEDAFRKKKRKRKGRGRSNDDDLSSSDSEPDTHRSKQPDRTLQPTAVRKKLKSTEKEDSGNEDKPQYRDRAKERREGKNADYKDSERIMETVVANGEASMDQTEMSKYLGGDEVHTHLVKGLDVALARSVKNQYQSAEGDGSKSRKDLVEFKPVSSTEEAWNFISKLDSNTVKTMLGKSMLKYLIGHQKKFWDHVPTSAAGAVIQRSQVTFSTRGDPRDLATSWQIPSEKSHPAATSQSTALSKVSPLDLQLIQNIQKVQASRYSSLKQVVSNEEVNEAEKEEKKGSQVLDDDRDEDIFQIISD